MTSGTGRTVIRTLLVSVLAVLLLVAGGGWLLVRRGFSARGTPSAIEELVARRLRHFSIPPRARQAKNPVASSPQVLTEARAHFADHCASCHGNDGRGKTTLGQNMYPKAPDMWDRRTQDLSDGELFYIIKNGVRLTGMAAWGEDTPDDDRTSWNLVHLVRYLPRLSPEELKEMQALNPRSPEEFKEEEEQEKFLRGEDDGSSAPQTQTEHHH